MANVQDKWTAGTTYEDFMGRWSRRLAPRFVSWLEVPPGVHWLDVGCGTGSLAKAVCENAHPASVTGCDPAEPFIEFAQAHFQDVRVSFVVAGVGSLPRRTEGYDCVTSLLALNFFPDARAAVDEMQSVAAPQGMVSACVWDYGNGMEFLRRFWDVATMTDAAVRELDEAHRFPLCHPRALIELFRSAGLRDVRCDPIEIRTPFASFDDYWQPFLGGTGPAPSYIASLDADHQAFLAQKLQDTLQQEPDGTIALNARAWAIRGTANR